MNFKVLALFVVAALTLGVAVAHEGECGGTTPCGVPDNTPLYAAAGLAALGLAAIVYKSKKLVRNKIVFDWKNIVQYGIAWLVIVGLGYSVYSYYNSPQVEQCSIDIGGGVVAHCHFKLYLDVCGNTIPFAWEIGDINGFHTHKDSHIIHFHPPNAVANLSTAMTLQNVFRDFKLQISGTSFTDPNGVIHPAVTGEGCNGSVYTTFNGQVVKGQEMLTKTINDGGIVRVVYG